MPCVYVYVFHGAALGLFSVVMHAHRNGKKKETAVAST